MAWSWWVDVMSHTRVARVRRVVREELGQEICPVVERAMVALIEVGHTGLAQELNAARWTTDRLRGALVGVLLDDLGHCPCDGPAHNARCLTQRLKRQVRQRLEGV